jgi:proline dehydrogenase
MAGDGYPMVATHDPRLVAITEDLARRLGRAKDSFEFQMLYGIRPHEQERLAAQGQKMRVYVPYGDEWYGYLVRRMADDPRTSRSSYARWPPRARRDCRWRRLLRDG